MSEFDVKITSGNTTNDSINDELSKKELDYTEYFIHNSVKTLVELEINQLKKQRYIGRKQQHILWHFIHSLTHIYPENPTNEEKILFADFFVMHLKDLIPFCGGCKDHYEKTIREANFDEIFMSKETLMKYFIDFHNQITIKKHKNKKPSNINDSYKLYDYDEVNEFYNKNNFINYFNKFFDMNIKNLIYNAQYQELTEKYSKIYNKETQELYLLGNLSI